MAKRCFDLVMACLLLITLSPALLGIAMLVFWKFGRPVFFTQMRPGYQERPFRLLKFRTMIDAVDSKGNSLPDAERLTAFGRKLRSTSLDELPSLINVLRGQMSLVGPRPLLMQYLPLYSAKQARRHEVRPGLTGWAQVNGRNALTWEEKFELDVWYIDHRSFLLDARILWLTVKKVMMRDGISSPGEATMTPFTGEKN